MIRRVRGQGRVPRARFCGGINGGHVMAFNDLGPRVVVVVAKMVHNRKSAK
jgi:hypothetical protein